MRKGVLELCILSIIGKRDEVYASGILHELRQARMIGVEGTLYSLLTRLKMMNSAAIAGKNPNRAHPANTIS